MDAPITESVENPKKATVRLRRATPKVTERQWELINWCVQATQSLGIPKSIGEIFGLIFSSDVPLSFDDVVGGLGISTGSASYGLRALRRMGAIKSAYEAREHRDFYVPETSLRKVLHGFLGETILLHLGGTREKLEVLVARLQAESAVARSPLSSKAEVLLQWNEQARVALRAGLEALS